MHDDREAPGERDPRLAHRGPLGYRERPIFELQRPLVARQHDVLAREMAKTETSRYQRKKVEMLFAHLKRILKLDRLRLRGPNGARDEFHLAATAQNLRKLAKLIPARSPILPT